MFTPQQLTEVGFTKAVFGGYDMESVHDVLDPLTEDYTTLYKENAVLKSKLRILVEKLEEYRQQGAPGEQTGRAVADAEEQAREIIRNAEDKAAGLIRDAHERARTIVGEAGRTARVQNGAVELEQDRLAQARQTAASFIQAVQASIDRHQELLDNLKLLDLPGQPEPEPVPAPAPEPVPEPAPQPAPVPQPAPAPEPAPEPVPEPIPAPILPNEADSDEIAKEIEQSVEKLVGTVPNSTYDASKQDTRVMPPLHPESITAKFGDLQFGKNYNPKN